MARITFGITKTQNYIYLTIAIVHSIAEYSYSVEFRHLSDFKFEFVQSRRSAGLQLESKATKSEDNNKNNNSLNPNRKNVVIEKPLLEQVSICTISNISHIVDVNVSG
ncbi:hypothetical protein Glove_19g180 [Diversispora epigaea]|uniref:Uncharacterized protein n=1 Tax=Diversispora epigaea TaxID=1348612 RepID=A0A397JKY1_9GLOM|nr:hypothetical protein Glove_19g180 [Diversispora epigaea]